MTLVGLRFAELLRMLLQGFGFLARSRDGLVSPVKAIVQRMKLCGVVAGDAEGTIPLLMDVL